MSKIWALEQINRLRRQYPEGTRIQVDNMENDPRPIPSGTKGTVLYVDDIGTIHCKFDNGSMFADDTAYCVEFFSAALVDHTDALYEPTLDLESRLTLLQEKSTQFREISVAENGRLLTLSTCSTAGEDLRVIVTGRLIPVE